MNRVGRPVQRSRRQGTGINKNKNHYPKHALPARIAAGVCCRSFYAERIFSLELLFLLIQAKRKNQLFLINIILHDANLEIEEFNMLLINTEFLL
jgi:hypothetical protein